MKHWWVPGLQIGYEHTFIHQVADFLEALGDRQAGRADVSRWSGDGLRDRRRFGIGQDAAMGESAVAQAVECSIEYFGGTDVRFRLGSRDFARIGLLRS